MCDVNRRLSVVDLLLVIAQSRSTYYESSLFVIFDIQTERWKSSVCKTCVIRATGRLELSL